MRADTSATINRRAWDRQARLALPDDRPMTPGRVEWTQYPGHGPRTERFGDVAGLSVAELGCGTGDNLAPLALAGARCVGVDLSPAQISRARTRWGHLPIELVCSDARAFLTTCGTRLDVCFSIFGAVGLCPPDQLLLLITGALRPGGRLLVSVPDPRWLGPRRDHLLLTDGNRVPVARWTAGPIGWRAAIEAARLHPTSVEQVDSPDGTGPCCTVMAAQRPSPG